MMESESNRAVASLSNVMFSIEQNDVVFAKISNVKIQLPLSPQKAQFLLNCCQDNHYNSSIETQLIVQFLNFYLFEEGGLSPYVDYNEVLGFNDFLLRPDNVSFEITKFCNLACIHCYNDSGTHQNKNLLSLSDKVHIVNYLGRWGVTKLTITGGEPTLDPDLSMILQAAKHHNIKTKLVTNGWLYTPAIDEAIKNNTICSMNISIDGPNANAHDSFRGRPGSFNRGMAFISKVKKAASVDVGINVAVRGDSIKEMGKMVEFAIDLGLSFINFKPVLRSGRGSVIASVLLNNEDIKVFKESILQLSLRHSDISIEGSVIDLLSDETVLDEVHCNAADSSCLITAEGELLPCEPCRGQLVKHKFLTSSPIQIWSSSPLFSDFRQFKSNFITKQMRGCCGNKFALSDKL